jgi:hypothetical protein
LLDSERELPRKARFFLANLLDRQLKKKPGTKLAAYAMTDHAVMLLAAKDDVAKLRNSGVSVKDALERVSEAHGIPTDILDKVHRGRHSGINRMNKRRP